MKKNITGFILLFAFSMSLFSCVEKSEFSLLAKLELYYGESRISWDLDLQAPCQVLLVNDADENFKSTVVKILDELESSRNLKLDKIYIGQNHPHPEKWFLARNGKSILNALKIDPRIKFLIFSDEKLLYSSGDGERDKGQLRKKIGSTILFHSDVHITEHLNWSVVNQYVDVSKLSQDIRNQFNLEGHLIIFVLNDIGWQKTKHNYLSVADQSLQNNSKYSGVIVLAGDYRERDLAPFRVNYDIKSNMLVADPVLHAQLDSLSNWAFGKLPNIAFIINDEENISSVELILSPDDILTLF